MRGKTGTLLLILGFVAVIVASFVWFIATWDPAREAPVVDLTFPATADLTA